MKNAVSSGIIIGIMSVLWLFIMRWAGYTTFNDQVAPIEYFSVLIPLIGLFLGVWSYRQNELNGKMNFIEGLVQGLKILAIGGAIAMFAGVIYVNYIEATHNPRDFSGRLFGALLLGVLFSLGVSLALMNKSSNNVD